MPFAVGEFKFVRFREFPHKFQIGTAVMPEAMVEMGGDYTEFKLLSLSEFVYANE